MQFQKLKILTGTAVSLLLSAALVYPATARPTSELAQGQLISQMNNDMMMTGTVRNILNERVTVEFPNGETRELMIQRNDIERLGLTPGSEIMVMLDDDGMTVTQVELVEDDAMTPTTTTIDRTANVPAPVATPRTEEVTGQIVSYDGDLLTLRLSDGTTRVYSVSPADYERMQLRSGQTIMIRSQGGVVSQVQPTVRGLW